MLQHRQGCFTERLVEKLCDFIWQDMEERDRRKTVTRGRRVSQKKAEERLRLSLPRYSGIQTAGSNWLYHRSLEGLGSHAGNQTGIWQMLVTFQHISLKKTGLKMGRSSEYFSQPCCQKRGSWDQGLEGRWSKEIGWRNRRTRSKRKVSCIPTPKTLTPHLAVI